MVMLLWKMAWNFLKKLKIELLYHLEFLLQVIYSLELKPESQGPRQRAQHLRVSTAFIETLSWAVMTHDGGHTTTCNSNFKGYSILFWPWRGILFLYISTLRIHIIKNKINSWKQNLRCLWDDSRHIRNTTLLQGKEKFYHLHQHRWMWRTCVLKAINWSLKAQCC